MKIFISTNLKELSAIFAPHGKLFVVGGYVRNSLLGFQDTDVDLAGKLTPEKVVQILAGTKFEVIAKSAQIGYVKIKADDEVFEYTTFRKDNYYNSGAHHVCSVSYVDDLRKDAMRRDFTINALYYDIETEKIIDIYSGVLDLKNHIMRTVEVPGFVLAHDGMRILRLIRLSAQLNFKIDFATLATAKKYAHLLHDISPAKKLGELFAMLQASTRYPISRKNAHIKALSHLNELHLWPSLYVQANRVHLMMVKKVSPEHLFYALLIDIINTTNPDCVEYYLKDLLGTEGFCQPSTTIAHTNNIICGFYDALNKMNNKAYFFKYFQYFEEIAPLILAQSKKLYGKYRFFYSYILKHKLPTSVKDLAINGKDLKLEVPELPEKKYSAVLGELLSKVFDGEIQNEKTALIQEVKNVYPNKYY